MDRLMAVLVRIIVIFSGLVPFFSKLSLCQFDRWSPGKKLKILLVGYNGARNTGADARVCEIIKQLETKLGKEYIEITVLTQNVENIAHYFNPWIILSRINVIFFKDLFHTCSIHHIALLCEGSTLKSKFANSLTLFFCMAAGIMKMQHKPCVAYGSEAGEMDVFLKKTVKKLCNKTYFISRTMPSLDVIKNLGLNGHLGTDTAWTFQAKSDNNNKLVSAMYYLFKRDKPELSRVIICRFRIRCGCW